MGFFKCNEKHDVEVTSSSWVNHHSTTQAGEMENLQNLSILSIRNLWEWCYSWLLMLKLLIIKYRSSRLFCEQMWLHSYNEKDKKKVSYHKTLDESRISNHWIGVQLWSISLLRIRWINLQTYPLMPGNNFNVFFHSQLLILKLARNQKKKKNSRLPNAVVFIWQ